MSEHSHRRVVAWCTVSIDGFSSGRAGPSHDTWLHEHAVTAQSEAYFESVWRGASTVVMGRTNAEGFGAVWPGMAVSADLSERSRAYGRFLVAVEKVGVSRSLPADGLDHFDWVHARVTDDLEGARDPWPAWRMRSVPLRGRSAPVRRPQPPVVRPGRGQPAHRARDPLPGRHHLTHWGGTRRGPPPE